MSNLWFEQQEQMTERQVKALSEADARAQNICGQGLGRWHVAFEAETRPGRGQDLTAWATDGEYMATQYLDVYGNGPLIVSSIELMHNDADEEHFDEYGDCEHEMQPYQANCGSWECRAPECGRKNP